MTADTALGGTSRRPSVVVAVDGGGEKTDAVVLTIEGELRARVTGPGSSPRVAGVEKAAATLEDIVGTVLAEAGETTPDGVHAFVSGLNLPDDTVALRAALGRAPWTHRAVLTLDNDMPALLRAGTDAADAVAVVCGTGINALGVRADGATATFAALGTISGDWGGGWELGQQALWHAARSRDGRGPATLLADAIPAAFGMSTLDDVIAALDGGRLPHAELRRLAPVLLTAATSGDEVAGALVDRQADEIITLACAALNRLQLSNAAVPVVFGGGVIASGNPRLSRGIRDGLAERAPHAHPVLLKTAPIVGAGVLAVAAAGGDDHARARARAALTAGQH
ncbi:N-acetylglucosamine kinase [Herbiconiux sp. L3-i23]|uniref:N-acetylglucosamine kinase n=1 Tax=Herbiconiux sp. L3-i23 TaxID=2905871 RepID=UPI00204897D8|nr:BadF/BadG/BcrA/BcrD ATPase family protein [Herbiconiux sp. L3-i23]BDI22524.1 kinase [Herbiconiux sp. L3-i23]